MEISPEMIGCKYFGREYSDEYSKPVFKYIKEYTEILQLLNLSVWKDLKDKLNGPNAEEVVVAVRTYLDSVRQTRELQLQYMINQTDEKRKVWFSGMDQVIKNYNNIPANDPFDMGIRY